MGTSTEARTPKEKCPSCSMEFPSTESLEEDEKWHREGVAQS